MSKITSMTGTLLNGETVTFSEKDLAKLGVQSFTSITVSEIMTEKEVLETYGHLLKPKTN